MCRCLSLTLPLTQLTEISIICLTKEENFLMQFHVIIHQMNLSVVYANYLAEKKIGKYIYLPIALFYKHSKK